MYLSKDENDQIFLSLFLSTDYNELLFQLYFNRSVFKEYVWKREKDGWKRSRGICIVLETVVAWVAIIDFMPHRFRKVKPE